MRNDRIEAPCLFDGPINGACFHAYVEQFLVPTLKPGDVVILDNLGSHKGKAVRKAIRDVGARLVFLPKYSPDRDRHCPKCQGAARTQWLEDRQGELLPVPYFHVVFTLPPFPCDCLLRRTTATMTRQARL